MSMEIPSMKTTTFLRELREGVEGHPALSHPVLTWLAERAEGRGAFLALGLQHYTLVGSFTSYLEELLITAPSPQEKIWIAKVLVDEYGGGSEGRDHATLYRQFLRAAGAQPDEELEVPLHANVVDFVATHQRLCRDEPFLAGFGALGPGHEWSIPTMFDPIVAGLRRVGFEESEIYYFTLHQEQDIDHGIWLEEALAQCIESSDDMACVRRGAMASLAARGKFWDAAQARIRSWLASELVPVANDSGPQTLKAMRRMKRVVKSRLG